MGKYVAIASERQNKTDVFKLVRKIQLESQTLREAVLEAEKDMPDRGCLDIYTADLLIRLAFKYSGSKYWEYPTMGRFYSQEER